MKNEINADCVRPFFILHSSFFIYKFPLSLSR